MSSAGRWPPKPGFNYSAALKAKGGTWTFDALDPWLANPRKDVPGTLMTFGGVPSQKQRADIIAYLNSNSDSPQPLPKAADARAGGAGEIGGSLPAVHLGRAPHADVKAISSRIAPGTLAPQFKST